VLQVVHSDIQIIQEHEMPVAIEWAKENPLINNPIRNTNHQYLKFLNSRLFSEEALHFMKYGYYTNAKFGTKDYNDYWDEQETRILEGYSVGGVRIPGRYYYFLNFGQMKARPIDPHTGMESKTRKIITFPRFLDHQYYFFLELEECFAEGPHKNKPMQGICVFKSRRKGYTYLIAVGVINYNFNFVPASMSVLAAYQKDFYKVTLDGVHFTLNHINKRTDFAKRRDKLDQREHIRASYTSKNELGMDIESGYMSEMRALSFKDDAFKSIGESCYTLCIEEAGQFPGMLSALTVAEPTYRDGDVMTGIPIIYGSAGSTGAVADLEEVFYHPEPYGLKAYENIYDENATGNCGWFIDDMWYYPGKESKTGTHYMVDAQGNSMRDLAEGSIDKKRALRKTGSKAAYNLFVTQQPKQPNEGFLKSEGTIFDTVAAKARLAEILTNPNYFEKKTICAKMGIDTNGNISWALDTHNFPIHEFPLKDNKDKIGVIEVFEMPVRGPDGKIPILRYIAGIDSYDDDASDTRSVGSCIVLDRWTDRIVAIYKGRPDTTTFYEQCRRLLLFYNATANYERRNKSILIHFKSKNCLHLMCDEPETLKDKGISKANTTGNNAKGTYPSIPVQNHGNSLMNAFLDSKPYDVDTENPESGKEVNVVEVTNMMRLRPVSLLREIIYWSPDPKKNFDDVDAFRMLMIYREDLAKYEVHRQIREKDMAEDSFFDRMRQKKYKVHAYPIGHGRIAIDRRNN